MDDGKPSGPRTKWWSRPSTDRDRPAGPEEDGAAATGVADASGTAPAGPGGTAGATAGERHPPTTTDGH
ncbi:hypothetical protein ACWGNQ_32830 [[Kitasatospora] papulosa]